MNARPFVKAGDKTLCFIWQRHKKIVSRVGITEEIDIKFYYYGDNFHNNLNPKNVNIKLSVLICLAQNKLSAESN